MNAPLKLVGVTSVTILPHTPSHVLDVVYTASMPLILETHGSDTEQDNLT